jgi:hypothetical protein
VFGFAVLLAAVAGAAGPVLAPSGPVAFGHGPPDCDADRQVEARTGQASYVGVLATGSAADWNGGFRLVGPGGTVRLAVGTPPPTTSTPTPTPAEPTDDPFPGEEFQSPEFEERIDAIGSTTPWHGVDPADWKALPNRVIFGGFVVGSLWLLSVVL